MRVLAVPVKPLERSKRRLSAVLSGAERAALTLAMLGDVLDSCVAQPGWEVWVVSGSDPALETAARWGVRPVRDVGRTLGAAVRQVEVDAADRDVLAVLLADLPILTAPALAWALSLEGPVIAAPADSDGGTNLLVRRPPLAMAARFGRSSFAKHRAEAYRAGLTLLPARRPELGFDLDRPEDLVRALAVGRPGRTLSACLEMGLPARLGLPA